MQRFEGTVRLAGDTDTIRATLLVAGNRLKVETSQQKIGEWELSELHSRLGPDGCHIVAEGEELIVSVAELLRFAEAIGPSVANPGDGSLLGRDPTDDPGVVEWIGEVVWSRVEEVPLRWKVVAALAVLGAVLFVLAPTALLGLVLLVALAGLLLGGYALLDPFMAVRLPDPLTPQLLLRAGAGTLIAALLLALIS